MNFFSTVLVLYTRTDTEWKKEGIGNECPTHKNSSLVTSLRMKVTKCNTNSADSISIDMMYCFVRLPRVECCLVARRKCRDSKRAGQRTLLPITVIRPRC